MSDSGASTTIPTSNKQKANEKIKNWINRISTLCEKVKKKIGDPELNTPRKRTERLILEMSKKYPELMTTGAEEKTTFLDQVKAYYEIKSIEREKAYKIILIFLTLITAWVGFQNLQLQKPNLVSIIGQNCPDTSFGFIQHRFSFVNVGKSFGVLTIGYKNNESAEIRFRIFGLEKESQNPQSLVVKEGEIVTYDLTAIPHTNSKFYNFTIYAKTDGLCQERTCNYRMDDNNPNRFDKTNQDYWTIQKC